jgi:hypothetical protein
VEWGSVSETSEMRRLRVGQVSGEVTPLGSCLMKVLDCWCWAARSRRPLMLVWMGSSWPFWLSVLDVAKSSNCWDARIAANAGL